MKSLPNPRVLRRICTASIAAFLGILATPEPGFAQTATGWTGTGANTNWSTASNWSNGSPAQFAPPQLVRDLYFGEAFANAGGAGSVVSVNDVAAFEGFRITFQDTTLAIDPAFVINGNGFTLSELGGVAPRIENQSGAVQTFSLTGALTLNGGTGVVAEINPLLGDLVFQNAVTLAGNTRLEVYGDNGHAVT